jgi:hypothetical protein
LRLACRAVVVCTWGVTARAETVVVALTTPNAAIPISKFLFIALSFK